MADKKFYLDVVGLNELVTKCKEYFSKKSDVGFSIGLDLNTTTYILTFSLKNNEGVVISSQSVDFPIESVVVSGRYDAENKEIILTLKDGNEINIPVGDLISGLQTELSENNKLNADYIESGLTNLVFTIDDKEVLDNAVQDIVAEDGNVTTEKDENNVVHISGLDSVVTADELEDAIKCKMARYGKFESKEHIDNPIDPESLITYWKLRIGVGLELDGNLVKDTINDKIYSIEILNYYIAIATIDNYIEEVESEEDAEFLRYGTDIILYKENPELKIYFKFNASQNVSWEDNKVVLDDTREFRFNIDFHSLIGNIAFTSYGEFIEKEQIDNSGRCICIDVYNRVSYLVKGIKEELYAWVNGKWVKYNIEDKLDKNLGEENKGKLLQVDDNGEIIPSDSQFSFASDEEVERSLIYVDNEESFAYGNGNSIYVMGSISEIKIEYNDGDVEWL